MRCRRTIKKRMSIAGRPGLRIRTRESIEGDPAPDQFSFAGGVETAENLTRTPVDFLRFDVGRAVHRVGVAASIGWSANGIWDIGHGMQLSGVYLYTDGGFLTTSCGCQTGTGLSNRQRLDGTVIELNNFDKKSIHRAGHAIPEAVHAGRPADARRDVGSVQSPEPRELLVLHDRREQPAVWDADVQQQSGLSAIHGPGGAPVGVLGARCTLLFLLAGSWSWTRLTDGVTGQAFQIPR